MPRQPALNALLVLTTSHENIYDVWHDRAVFHFLTSPSDRLACVHQVTRAVKPGGNVIVSTFGPEGPTKCSGLEVVRYDAESLHQEFGVRFRLRDNCEEMHRTPFGSSAVPLPMQDRMNR